MSRHTTASDTRPAQHDSSGHRPDVDAAPVELVAVDETRVGRIVARRDGEPGLTHVRDVADAMAAATERGVDLVVPADLFNRVRNQFPSILPPYVKLR